MCEKLKGKIALITGASRGIGRAIAIEFARERVEGIVLNYVQNDSEAEKTKEYLKDLGVKVLLAKYDISLRENVKNLILDAISFFGRIHILVNNAAILQQKHFEKITDEDWDKVFRINLKGPFMLIQEVIPYMLEQEWGRIINISSIGGQWGGNLAVHYAATKAALISLTLSIARIYSSHGITSNAVSPGLVLTEMAQKEINSEIGNEKLRQIPVGRFAAPEEVAKVVAFLAGEDASYITGQTINVNGGMLFSHGL